MTGGPELYGFPPPAALPDLRWLGPDYVSLLVHDLTRGLLRQDAGTRVMGIRCDGEPELTATVDPAGYIRAHEACFPLQVFLQDGTGRPWRLRGRWTYSGRDLGTAAATVTHSWRLLSADGV
ncbi:hypothetical protein Arub01_23770 [Actinomadura rubrobrunea]|uniref:Uncharacterized protein n=1 Tax=Actinomadura rubrobrunea TaxID=115335 RepID=A0A9W6PWD7_9ACTN|nr:hypothetical protein [Actinomadura rubrobrunea]MBX6768569.1 hypothetical protein [Actinomadura rubrobrunea]GLW64133.1 hypothetical protein Arub01_23770 [Actinomadura rubrobrunea]